VGGEHRFVESSATDHVHHLFGPFSVRGNRQKHTENQVEETCGKVI
jgi:hypothetical protein